MDIDKFLEFYKNIFIPVYADLVAYIADKPIQIIIEIENSFAHLTIFLDKTNTKEIQIENLNKAYNHLLRASLDCYKLLWIEMSKDIDIILKDENKRKFTTNMPEIEILQLYTQFKEKAKIARKKELQTIGLNNQEVLNEYKETIEIGWKILHNIDKEKLESYSKFNITNIIKQHGMGFIIGIISSIIASILWNLI